MINIEYEKNANLCKWLIALLVIPALYSQAYAEEDWPDPVQNQIYSKLIFDQLEHRWNDGPDTYVWDAQGWIGGDYNKLWVKTEGAYQPSSKVSGDSEVQVLYSKLIAPFWDLQVGLRNDYIFGAGPNRSRTLATIGVQGLAPYVFEVEPALFISDDGDLSARFTGSYDFLVSQRFIVQPRLEINVAADDTRRFGVGSGLNDVVLDLRFRYEIRREFAPYIGLSWTQLFGNTKDIARAENTQTSNFAAVAGIRIWF